jgi:hypothetical protein
MKPSEAQEVVSAGTAEPGGSDDLKLVPVSESIRYRRRARRAEQKSEALAEQLAEAKAEAKTTAEQLSRIQAEQDLVRKLAAAGTVDLEAAVLIAKARLEGEAEADVDSVIKQLKNEKKYLFAGASGAVTAKKTAGAKERVGGSQTVLESAAKKAATTGSRTDLQEYLKLRRNFI